MNKSIVLTAAAVLGVPALSHAGFTATFSQEASTNSSSILTVGNTLTSSIQTLTSYTTDSAADPQINGGDYAFYKMTLTATATSLSAMGTVYAGTYQLYYNFAGGINVSSGAANFTVSAVPGFSKLQVLGGSLTQTQGPANPAFANLAATYGNSPFGLNGTFAQYVTGNPHRGALQLNITQEGQPVPEPASMAALGVGAIGLLKRRRKA